MLFASFSFIIFILIFTLIYFSFPSKWRWLAIIIGSSYFYLSFRPEWPFLILISILVNYILGNFISNSIEQYPKQAKFATILGIILNLAYLAVFKYAYFISDSVRGLLSVFSIHLSPLEISILLPIGISFYTFQNISYLVDLYRKRFTSEKNLGIFAAYTLFFPKLVSGPIERPNSFISQLKEDKKFNYENIISGSKRIVWGLFKKLVIADRLGILVDVIYNSPGNYNTPYLLLATFFFGFQLYCDFSAYTDIAIGSARLLGYNLTENFRRPYLSKSVSEFWRRWHISLSSWFQDYVFVPLYLFFSKLKIFSKLDSSKKHTIAFIVSILIGETLLGVWHGANWTFVAFGLYYGIAISLYYLLRKRWDSANKYLQMILTFILVNLGWIFFRSNSISDAMLILRRILFDISFEISRKSIGIGYADLSIALIGIFGIILYDFLEENGINTKIYDKLPPWARALIFILLIILTLMIGVYTYSQFIYFQF